MSMSSHRLVFPLLLAAACSAGTTWMVQEENDKFTSGDRDRYYTQGLRVAWMNDDLSHWSFGQEINTSSDYQDSNPPPTDHPYSAFLYLSRGQAYVFPAHQAMASVECKLGVIGPWALGRQVQNGFHHLIDTAPFQGWDTQMPNELAFNLEAEVRRRFYIDASEVHHWDVIGRLGLDLGNVRSGFIAGTQLRFGLLDDSWGHGFLRQSTAWVDPIGVGGPREAWWWVFADVSAEVMPHVYATDGTAFHDSRSVDTRPVVLQGAFGVNLKLGAGSLSFALAHRTKDFETQQGRHAFGSFRFTYIF